LKEDYQRDLTPARYDFNLHIRDWHHS